MDKCPCCGNVRLTKDSYKYTIVRNPPTPEQLRAVMLRGPVRVSVDETKCVLKYPWPKPAALEGSVEYDYEGIVVQMAKKDWNKEVI